MRGAVTADRTERAERAERAGRRERKERRAASEEDAAELFRSLYPRLAGWCRRLVDDDGTAHEIASEAFTRLWARWTKVDEPTGFLYVTAANLVRDHWRRMERERRALRRAGQEESVRQATEGDEPSVRLLVQSLPERLRDPVLLYYFADLPVREVAARLGRPEGTVKSDLRTARELLRATLGGFHDPIR
ncbi:RNA polymerase sigma factor [Streptacidiphilus melanogenes]|uniref:RNA polymerase sigma factor n=1 Tax=Streptacidiphilus melanogenes TaxID=411235 RepID=UPI000A071690|nr:sigma-70 family RNA polymerase sigma factor [Streptacidiphilus melanogenes]